VDKQLKTLNLNGGFRGARHKRVALKYSPNALKPVVKAPFND
jgi:hypothetical protein